MRSGNKKPRTPISIGDRFGMLTVQKRMPYTYSSAKWVCACDCGKRKSATTSELLSGKIVSCAYCAKATSVVMPGLCKATDGSKIPPSTGKS